MAYQSQETYLKNPYVFNTMSSYQQNQNYHLKNQHPIQKLNNNFINSEKSISFNYESPKLNKSIDILPNQSKISYARNYKLLLTDINQSEEAKKEQQRENYRKELEEQIKADKLRKKVEKEKIEKEEIERERKFYAEIQIKAKQPKSKEEPSYIILRSGQKNRRKNMTTERDLDQSRLSDNKEKSKKLSLEPIVVPKIIKRGGYHNQSALDNNSYQKFDQETYLNPEQSEMENSSPLKSSLKSIHQSEKEERELEIIKERNYEEERINNIIKLQEKMLRKLDRFKEQIVKINKNLDLETEVHHIRNILKSKSVKLESWSVRNDPIFENYNDFYRFPSIETKNLTSGSNRPHRSRVEEGMNLNQEIKRSKKILTEENEENEEENENKFVTRRKREIKTMNRQNDKNIDEKSSENQSNEFSRIPVVLE